MVIDLHLVIASDLYHIVNVPVNAPSRLSYHCHGVTEVLIKPLKRLGISDVEQTAWSLWII